MSRRPPRYRQAPTMFVRPPIDMDPPPRPIRIEDYPIIQEPQTPLKFQYQFPSQEPNFDQEPNFEPRRDLNDVWF